MVGLFKHKNPGNALVLLLYGLVLKFPLFMHPARPLPNSGDNYIYHLVLRFFEPMAQQAPIIYSILAFLLFFTQATLLNRIANSLKLFPKANYLVGMSFLLVSSLFSTWNSFSAPLLVNSLLVWIWYRMVGLYNNTNPKTSIYNVAVLVGLLPLLYSPALPFALLLAMALIISRPMRITEWMVAILGFITPYYFIFVILFLADQWKPARIIPAVVFQLPRLPASYWLTSSIILLIGPFITGSFLVQKNLGKMLIQVRKSWSLLLVMLIISLLIMVIHPAGNYVHWLFVIIPLSAFHAATYFFSGSKWATLFLHWLTFTFAVLLTYHVFDYHI